MFNQWNKYRVIVKKINKELSDELCDVKIDEMKRQQES